MIKYFLIFFCFLLSFKGISQTECDYNVSFFLKTRKGKIVNTVFRKEIDKGSYIYQYSSKKKKHYFRLGRINYCHYQLTLKKGNKKLTLVFHNTKERTSFADLGTLPMIDTTIHFHDGLRYKKTPVSLIVLNEMPRIVIPPDPELLIKLDTTTSFVIPVYGGFNNVRVELAKNRIGIDPTSYASAVKIAQPYHIYLKNKPGVFLLSESRIESFTQHNERHNPKLKLGKVYQLSFTNLVPERNMIVAFYGSFQVVKNGHVTLETLENFAKVHNIKITKTKSPATGMFTLTCTSNDLFNNYKIISESGLFSLIEPSFLSNNTDISRTKGNVLKPINPFFNGEITIDSVEFYSKIMNDLPSLYLPVFTSCIVTRNEMCNKYRNTVLNNGENVLPRMKLSDSLFKEAQFMLTQLPINYLDSTGNYGDCLVNLNQSSNYNCFTIVIYKSDGKQLMLQGNELPGDLHTYYYKAYKFNDRLRESSK